MATKAERVALVDLLDEIETLRCWLDDTAYPRQSRAALEKAVETARKIFRLDLKGGENHDV